jgi:cell pole-organizing protein PopZ
MAKGNVASEPSMEEILASIRKIIADEEPAGKTKEAYISEALPDEADDFAAVQAARNADDVLDLGMAEEEAATIPAKPVAPVDMDDLSFDGIEEKPAPRAAKKLPKQNDWSEPVNQPAPKPRAAPMPQQNYAPSPSPGLVSAHTGAAVHAAFNSLADSIFSNEPRTIEDLTKEMLTPLLKQWLDDNLPSLVERIIRDEIERVARGGNRA